MNTRTKHELKKFGIQVVRRIVSKIPLMIKVSFWCYTLLVLISISEKLTYICYLLGMRFG